MNRWLLFALAAALASAGCVDRGKQEQAKRTASIVTDQTPVVDVRPVRLDAVTEELEITGDIATGEDTSIGAKLPGRIMAVYVRDGDSVSAGQLLATLDTSQIYAQLKQSQAQVQTAMAGLNSAMSNLIQARRNAAAGPQRTSAALRSAEAQLRSAKAQLSKAKAGGRPEEITQAEWAVAAAKKDLETQQKELDRIQRLVAEGAIAANRLDQQQNLVMAAETRYNAAQQQLTLAKAGARAEDVESAQEAVRQAQEAVNTAKIQKQLDPLLQDQVHAAEAQVASSRSQLDAARASVNIVQQSISDMQIRAPFSGKVLGNPAQPGTVASGSTTIVRLIGGTGVYFSGDLPATVVDQVRPGMPVNIHVDGFEGKSFTGVITSVSPIGQSVGRLFSARVSFTGVPAGVKPGMFAHGSVALRTIQNATLVPIDAVVTRGEDKYVYYVDNGVAKRATVTAGVQKGTWIQVTGVPVSAMIVVDGQQKLQDGVKVKVKETASAAASTKESQS